jgi:hypothetical protein
LGAASLVPCWRLVPPTALLGIAGGPVARVGGPVAGVGDPLPLIGEVIAFVGGPVALIGEVVVLVGGPLPLVEVVPAPVQGGGASSQPGLDRLQRLLGLPSPRLGRPNPSVIDRQARDPLTLGLLDDLLGQVGQLP